MLWPLTVQNILHSDTLALLRLVHVSLLLEFTVSQGPRSHLSKNKVNIKAVFVCG
jgi:hypothetical protein